MAQTAKDNSGPGGLFSKQMTAAEDLLHANRENHRPASPDKARKYRQSRFSRGH